ncbi:MAG: efflux RND transporter permease subunit [Deltaproteobacteria bacterium]|nr:efflux RND transporter permease subunit [Deltaproteobacteria bacterium]
MLTDFFLQRPVLSIVCSTLFTLAGLLTVGSLPIAQYPELAPPTVNVVASYVGAGADVVETAVTVPLEQELNGVEGMRFMSSISSNEGQSNITITFEPERDLDIAAVDVQNRVARAAARLPAQVNETGIVINKASGQLLLTVGIFSDGDVYQRQFLSNYADVVLRDAIKRIPGVADVRIFGERKLAMRIWLDPTQLARRSLTVQDVVVALREQNVQTAAGQIGQPPTGAAQPYQLSVRAVGRLSEPAEFEDVVVKSAGPGSGELVRLKDVARVELGAESYGSVLFFRGKPAVGLGIIQLPTANALDVRDAVLAELARLSKTFPPGMRYLPATDTTLAVRASMREVTKTLLEAIALVILVIFVFLHGWRSVLLTAVTLPVSLVGTFAFVKLFGFSINTLTLFGLTLATGLVVDDAIVVIENIERLMAHKGLSAREAARVGMREVGGAVIAISIVLIAVFVPVALFPGTTGTIYRQFALTIAASVALSTFCALTLTPSLGARMLAAHAGEKWALFRQVDATLERARRRYGLVLRAVLRRPLALLAAFLLLAGATAVLFRSVPTGFIPDEDQGYLIISVQGPEGTSLEQTQQVLLEGMKVVHAQPEVNASFIVGGFTLSGSGPNLATMFVTLLPWEERQASVGEVVERLRGPLGRIGGARIVPFQPPAIRGVGSVGGFQFIVTDTSAGRSLGELSGAVQDLVARANQDPRLRGIFTSFTADTPILEVEVDRNKAKALGVAIDQVFGALQAFLGSQFVNDFVTANRTYRVFVQAETEFRDDPQDISELYVRGAGGAMIPLEALVSVKPTTSAAIIRHYNLFRSAEINGGAAPGVSTGEAISAMEQLAQAMPEGVAGQWTGISLEQKESAGKAPLIFALGVLFVFFVLAAQYESFVLPLVIILSVPIAVLGGLGLQAARGLAADVFCQIGLVMLVGLASKNAILIVEFAEQLRRAGASTVDAVIEAAQIRLRPILMTSFAFLLGVVPLMLASGPGAGARASLGTTVFGGMLVSTFVNLVFIPGLYVLARRSRTPA